METRDNQFYQKAFEQAKAYFADRNKVLSTLDNAFQKALHLDKEKSEISSLVDKVKLFVLMIRAYITGEYREVPWKSILMIFAGLIYFVNPFDLISDFIPGIGYVDDFAIMLYIFKSVEADIRKFEEFFYS